jgi:hypothetical protein
MQKTTVVITRCAKNAMQSGVANTDTWVLRSAQAGSPHADPLMGWSGGRNTTAQLKLTFASCDEAIAYAQRHGLSYVVQDTTSNDSVLPRTGKSYAQNFATHRRGGVWTH